MPFYALIDPLGIPLLTLTAASDEAMEMDLIMFANVVAGKKGFSHVENKGEYWKVSYTRYQGQGRFLIVKRKDDQ